MGPIEAVLPTSEVVGRLAEEYSAARQALTRATADYGLAEPR